MGGAISLYGFLDVWTPILPFSTLPLLHRPV